MPWLAPTDLALLVVIAVMIAGLALYGVISGYRSRLRLRRRLDEQFGRAPGHEGGTNESVRGAERAGRYWELRQRHEHLEDCVDDRTWDDLDMDRVFARIDTCLTSVGSQCLYAVLREPRFDEQGADGQESLMAFLAENPATRLELQLILSKMGRSDYNELYLFNYEAAPPLVRHPALLNVLAVLPLLLAAFFIVSPPFALVAVVLSAVVNGMIHYRTRRKLELSLDAMTYLANMLWSVRRALALLRDEAVPEEVRECPILRNLGDALKVFEPIRSPLSGTTRQGRLLTEADSFIEFARIVFLTQVRGYNRTACFLAESMPAFRMLYRGLGEMELALAVLSLRMSLPYHVRPVLTDETAVKVRGLYHPLLEDAVPNDAALTRNSLVSGSNASGKSTFIKALAINGILAQTIGTCTATHFQSRPALVVTSMAVRDDLLAGESYFIAEIRSLKRLVEQAQRRHCLCFVDEILKGTNTVERIAASAAVLRRFSGLDSLCLVATHDIELTVLLKDLFDNYHFEEQVTDEGVSFDYLMRSGPSRTRNAIKLLAAMGCDEETVHAADALVEAHERTGHW
jgi:hypothetical protein